MESLSHEDRKRLLKRILKILILPIKFLNYYKVVKRVVHEKVEGVMNYCGKVFGWINIPLAGKSIINLLKYSDSFKG